MLESDRILRSPNLPKAARLDQIALFDVDDVKWYIRLRSPTLKARFIMSLSVDGGDGRRSASFEELSILTDFPPSRAL
jgi:hypothetical protein